MSKRNDDIKPKNKAQSNLINSFKAKALTVALGSAGTGKSFLSACAAADALLNKQVRRVVISRPNIPISKGIGFLPGTLEEKMTPWAIPILKTMEERLGKGVMESQLKNGNIELVPFEMIRGRSFEDCFVILDEAQNTTEAEMKAFVTRIGEHSTCVITGDVTQSDIGKHNGLSQLLRLVEKSKPLQRYVGVVEFTSDDIVRSGLCQLFVQAYEAESDH